MAQFVDTIVPEGARPAVKVMLKHHFWILSVLLPLVLLPLLFVGSGAIGTQIDARRQEIDGKISQVKQVSQLNPHPNEAWSTVIEGQAATVRQELNQEWSRLWESQKPLRTWQDELGPDFKRTIERLRTNEELPRPLLLRYQTTAPRLVMKLPERMGVQPAAFEPGAGGAGALAMPDPRMGSGAGPGFAAVPGGVPGSTSAADVTGSSPFVPAKLAWNPADQTRIFQSFVWTAVPTTRQVLMAQERLWVYGLFCDIVQSVVKDATGPHDSPIAFVDELAIGQDAAEPAPGGMLDGRIFIPAAARGPGAGPGMGSGMDMSGMGSGMGMEQPMGGGFGAGRRGGRGMRLQRGGGSMDTMGGGFGGSPAGPGVAGNEGSGPPSDAELLSYAYVDFGGSPLAAESLVSEPGAEMVHLMPFVLRVVVDQRKIDSLLVTLAASPVPIDVRQIRINADNAATFANGDAGGIAGMVPGGFSEMGGLAGAGGPQSGSALRRHDVRLELRGTIALATKPGDPVVLPPAGAGVGAVGTGSHARLIASDDQRRRPSCVRPREVRS